MLKIAILGSGRGSNAEAILKAKENNDLGETEITCIISDNEDAQILKLGTRYNVPAYFIDPGPFKTKLTEDHENDYVRKIKESKADLIVLTGFMRVVKQPLLSAFNGRIINLHPSILPKYPGLNSIKRALDAGDTEIGCTVHWVNNVIDAGEIIKQATIKVEKTDTLESLESKIHTAEHALLPTVIRDLANKLLQK